MQEQPKKLSEIEGTNIKRLVTLNYLIRNKTQTLKS